MSNPAYCTIIERLFTELDLLLNKTIFNGYSALASYLKMPLELAILLYISLIGLSIAQGWIKLSMANLVKSVVKLALIYIAAMNWSWFSHYIVDFINKGAWEIGTTLVSATPMPISHSAGDGMNGAIQSVLTEFTKVGNRVWEKGAWNNPGPFFTALLVWGFGYTLILVAVFELVLAKIMLAMLFSTAPLFISFTLFKVTHGIFDRWLGACIGFALLMIFVSSILALTLSIAQWAIFDPSIRHAVDVSLVGFLPVMIVGFIGIGIILKASHLAQSIGGVIATASGSSLLAGVIGGVVGSTLLTLKIPLSVLGANRQEGLHKSNSAAMRAIRKELVKPENKRE